MVQLNYEGLGRRRLSRRMRLALALIGSTIALILVAMLIGQDPWYWRTLIEEGLGRHVHYFPTVYTGQSR